MSELAQHVFNQRNRHADAEQQAQGDADEYDHAPGLVGRSAVGGRGLCALVVNGHKDIQELLGFADMPGLLATGDLGRPCVVVAL